MKHFVEADPTDQPYRNYSEYLAHPRFRRIRAEALRRAGYTCQVSSLDMFDWLVVGGASKSTQTAEFVPPVEWTFHLWQQAQAANVPIYMKTNLFGNDSRHREYPAQIDG